jgi:hypothetical protein
MDTKVTTAFLAGVLTSGGLVYAMIDGEQVQVVKDPPAASVLLSKVAELDPDIREEIKLVGRDEPDCYRCKTMLGKQPDVEGWCCDGAFMPARIQELLNDAAKEAAKVELEPAPVEEIVKP